MDEIARVQNSVEVDSKKIDEVINLIIKPYCEPLDKYVQFVANILKDGENPPTTSELEDFCLNLSAQIYFAGGLCENLGVRDDIAKALYKEQYHSSRNSLQKGTIADKDSQATLQSQNELIVSMSYTRAYKTMKAKVDAAQELLSSCKKVLSHRIQEEQLTNMMGDK